MPVVERLSCSLCLACMASVAHDECSCVLLSGPGAGDRQPVISLAVGLAERRHDFTFLCDVHTGCLVAGTDVPTVTHDVEQVGRISLRIRQTLRG
jgi:hypothetical protein